MRVSGRLYWGGGGGGEGGNLSGDLFVILL